jgi:nucleotide-binding universal stress UspA family protein
MATAMNSVSLIESRLLVSLPKVDHILFLTDFSTASWAAVPHLAAIAHRYSSSVYVLHVVMPHKFPIISAEDAPFTFEEARRRGTQALAKLSRSPLLEEIPLEPLLAEGEIAEVVNLAVKKRGIDLIVVGTHGRRGFRRLTLGSVAEEVFRNSPCPVLTVGPHVSAGPGRELPLRRILHATDLSLESFSAAPYALSLALEHKAHLTVLHVLPQKIAGSLERSPLPAILRDDVRAMLPAEAQAWDDFECVVKKGGPKETILRVAKERGADLIVLGVRPGDALATHRLGNVAYDVVIEAPCPVLTVRADRSHECERCVA